MYNGMINPNAIRGSIASIALDFGISIIPTRNAQDTAAMIKRIAIREQSGEKTPIQIRTDKKPVNLWEQQLFIIESLPNIGPVNAKNLLEHFGTVANIINASESQLQEVEGIGKKTAANIRKVVDSKYLYFQNEIKEKTIDKEYVNKLIVKIESYEEIINKFMDKFTEIEGDREKLIENIDLLNDKIKQKNIQINEIEIKLSESQDSIEEYKAKINDIEGLNKSLLQDHSDEIVNLKQIIKQKEDEIKTCNENVQDMKESKNKSEKIVKGNLIEISSLNERIEKYKNEIEAYISKITELNMQLNKNEEKINNLNKINKELSNSNNELSNSNNELSSINNEIKEKSNNEITNLKKLLNKIKIENMKYVNEIEELNLQLNELNDAFTVEKQEKLKYVNEIKILNIKIRELSRIRRNGFM